MLNQTRVKIEDLPGFRSVIKEAEDVFLRAINFAVSSPNLVPIAMIVISIIWILKNQTIVK